MLRFLFLLLFIPSVAFGDTIPRKAEVIAMWDEWMGYLNDYIEAQPTWDNKFVKLYYDCLLGTYQLEGMGYATNAADLRADCLSVYRDDYYLANNGAVPGYQNFSVGLKRHYDATGSALSLEAINDLAANASYSQTDTEDLTDTFFSREVAYSLITLSIAGSNPTRQAELDGYVWDHFEMWDSDEATQSATKTPYVRPFMVAISARAIILYRYNSYDAATKAAFVTLLGSVAGKLWTWNWSDPDNAMIYTKKWRAYQEGDNTVGGASWEDGGDADPAPDLNHFIAPIYAWLYSVTGDTTHRERYLDMFAGGEPVYDEWGFYVSGPYLGTRSSANPDGKHLMQQLFWSKEGMDWVENYTGPTAPSASSDVYAAVSASDITNTTAAQVKAAAGAGTRNYVTSLTVSNLGSVSTRVDLLDGATVLWSCPAAAAGGGCMVTFPTPLRGTANTAISCQAATTGAQVRCAVAGYARD